VEEKDGGGGEWAGSATRSAGEGREGRLAGPKPREGREIKEISSFIL
jgi:hypothetical protein